MECDSERSKPNTSSSPVSRPSVNEPSAKTFAQAIEYMGDKADLVIEDFGYEAKGLESTVAVVVEDEIKVLRQGAIQL